MFIPNWRGLLAVGLALWCTALCAVPLSAGDPLPSWNCTGPKRALVAYLKEVTNLNSEIYLPIAERIAVFDEAGTLWPEKPVSLPIAYAHAEARRLASEFPHWADSELLQLALQTECVDLRPPLCPTVLLLLQETEQGQSETVLAGRVRTWLNTAQHPLCERRFADCAYQPMIELVDLFRVHGFKTYLVTSGPLHVARVWAEDMYAVPAEQVIAAPLFFPVRASTLTQSRNPAVTGTALPQHEEAAALAEFHSRQAEYLQSLPSRPLVCFSSRPQRLEILNPANPESDTARLQVLIKHTDVLREFAYEPSPRDSAQTSPPAVESEGPARPTLLPGSLTIDMQADWRTIFSDHSEPIAEAR